MRYLRFNLCSLAVFAVGACVYDFHPEYQGQAGFVAIEGDPLVYTLRVEAGDGTVYPLQDSIVDLTKAGLSQEYRLVVEVLSPFRQTYASTTAPASSTGKASAGPRLIPAPPSIPATPIPTTARPSTGIRSSRSGQGRQ